MELFDVKPGHDGGPPRIKPRTVPVPPANPGVTEAQAEAIRKHNADLKNHKANEARIARGKADPLILDYVGAVLRRTPEGEWSEWFRPEHTPGVPIHECRSIAGHVYRAGVAVAADTCRRRLKALAKRGGYETENQNATGRYRVRRTTSPDTL